MKYCMKLKMHPSIKSLTSQPTAKYRNVVKLVSASLTNTSGVSASFSMLLCVPTPTCQAWLHTAAMTPFLSHREQDRVSPWVGLLRGPGWFRSDARRKLRQEIPNCQTYSCAHTAHKLSFYWETDEISCSGLEGLVLSEPSVQNTSPTARQAQLYILRYDHSHAQPGVLHDPEFG